MAINWGLINPEIPAQARTIDAFGAVEAGRNQVRAQQEQQQMSGLRAIQMQSAKQGLDDAKSSQEAAQLAAQAFELHERDPEAARPLFERGYQTNAKAFTDVFKGLQAQKDAHRKSQLDEDKTKAELLDKNAPIMLAAIDAEDKQPGAGRAILEQAGIYNEQVHGANLADQTKRAAARQYLEQMPVIVNRRAAEEKARRDAARDASADERDERRTAAAERKSDNPVADAEARHLARVQAAYAKPANQRNQIDQGLIKQFEAKGRESTSGADMYLAPTPQSLDAARKAMSGDPELEDFAGNPAAQTAFHVAWVRAQRDDGMDVNQAYAVAKEAVMKGVVDQPNRVLPGVTPRYAPTAVSTTPQAPAAKPKAHKKPLSAYHQ